MIFGTTALKTQYELRIAEQKQLYEAQIGQLQTQIKDLRTLAFSQTSSSRIPLVALEADAIMSQRDETIEIDPEELAKLEDEQSEANRILSGNY